MRSAPSLATLALGVAARGIAGPPTPVRRGGRPRRGVYRTRRALWPSRPWGGCQPSPTGGDEMRGPADGSEVPADGGSKSRADRPRLKGDGSCKAGQLRSSLCRLAIPSVEEGRELERIGFLDGWVWLVPTLGQSRIHSRCQARGHPPSESHCGSPCLLKTLAGRTP